MISIIIPTLNEASRIAECVAVLQSLPGRKEVIVADGGSKDSTVCRARAAGAIVVECDCGRGVQMHTAARIAHGEVFWFLHADTLPEPEALARINDALLDERVAAGNFSLVFDGAGLAARQMTWIYPRLRLLGLVYGYSGLFVRRLPYETIGGFQPYPLFEDLDLIRRLRRHGRFVHLTATVRTSSRRFGGPQYARVWVQWIVLQVLFWVGVSPYRLGRWYRHVR